MPYNSSENKGAEFWERVAVELKRKGWRQAELVRQSSVDQGAISSGQRRKSMPLADNALRIAEALGVTLQYLLYGKREEHIDPNLEDAFDTVRKSERGSNIVKSIPNLSDTQLTAIETMLQSWGIDAKSPENKKFAHENSGGNSGKALA